MIKFLALALFFFMSFSVAFAQPKDLGVLAGLTPQSPFYFFDSFGEWLNLKFTFNPLKKAEKKLGYASERLAELKTLENAGDIEESDANELLGDYKDLISEVDSDVEDLKAEGVDVIKIEEMTKNIMANHSVFLQDILKNVSEQTEEIVRQTIDFSNKVYEDAMEATRVELEKALEETRKGVEEGFQEANKSIKEGFGDNELDDTNTDTE